ncbi:hypothetical protein HU200_016689 [Digitaria exilis]|uniref:Uncharacterized protein n=1 Tax=Digitaria exilis TaxID=1010633 RepID=A0A835KJJ5_9POAL|nr:hypothetical protein HU200_016689 [Digitaria exilis]
MDFLEPVNGRCCFGKNCTKRQKNYIIDVCYPYILKQNPSSILPRKDDICCKEVRILQTNVKGMMQCIVDLFTPEDEAEYDIQVMLYLGRYCTQPPFPTPPYEVKKFMFQCYLLD